MLCTHTQQWWLCLYHLTTNSWWIFDDVIRINIHFNIKMLRLIFLVLLSFFFPSSLSDSGLHLLSIYPPLRKSSPLFILPLMTNSFDPLLLFSFHPPILSSSFPINSFLRFFHFSFIPIWRPPPSLLSLLQPPFSTPVTCLFPFTSPRHLSPSYPVLLFLINFFFFLIPLLFFLSLLYSFSSILCQQST